MPSDPRSAARRRPALLLLLSALLAAAGLLAGAGGASGAVAGEGSFNIDPTTGEAGTTVAAFGRDWGPEAKTAELFLADPTGGGVSPVASAPIAAGSFDAQVTIPATATDRVPIFVRVSGPKLPAPIVKRAVFIVASATTTAPSTTVESTTTTDSTTTTAPTTTTASTTTTVFMSSTTLLPQAVFPVDADVPPPPPPAELPTGEDDGPDPLVVGGMAGLFVAVVIGSVEAVSVTRGHALRVPVAATAAGVAIISVGALALGSVPEDEVAFGTLRVTTVQKSLTISAPTTSGAKTVTAICPEGQRVLGGGYSSDWDSSAPARVPAPGTTPLSGQWVLVDPTDPEKTFPEAQLQQRYQDDWPWWYANQQDVRENQVAGRDTQFGPRFVTSAPTSSGTGWEVAVLYTDDEAWRPLQVTASARCAPVARSAFDDGMPADTDSLTVPAEGTGGIGYCADDRRLLGAGWRDRGGASANPQIAHADVEAGTVIVDGAYTNSPDPDPDGVCAESGGDVDLRTQVVTSELQVKTGEEGEASVVCPSGWQLVGGGWDSGFRGNARRTPSDPWGTGPRGLGPTIKDLVPIANGPSGDDTWKVRVRSTWLDVADWADQALVTAEVGRPVLLDRSYAATYGREWAVRRASMYTHPPYHSVRVQAVCAQRPQSG